MDRGTLNLAFGAELRSRRKAAGLEQKDVWTALAWRRNTYKRTESGDRAMSPEDILDVAEFLNIAPTTFFASAMKRWKAGDFPTPTGAQVWDDILGI
ncbi:helix-turn-helix domain-containing protein [Nocardia acidivorans]|uniref:helix-turn-helix domain-containing protein n=1 Tax=Nocardia acidivorans TaxID=404580 RepID=UPI00083357C5|nr:helix-turn-helix transcriptional regulator [Nocardia acidivorans]